MDATISWRTVASRFWSEVLMHIVHRPPDFGLMDEAGFSGTGRVTTQSARHFAILIITFIHFVWHRSLPPDLFCQSPNDFATKNQPFLVEFPDLLREQIDFDSLQLYARAILRLVADWENLPLEKNPDSGAERLALYFLFVNVCRLLDGAKVDVQSYAPKLLRFVAHIQTYTVDPLLDVGGSRVSCRSQLQPSGTTFCFLIFLCFI